jgi:formamidopyrimidine-DNA glycosylase
MPELPEVDTIRRQLAPLVSGRQLLDGWSHPSAKFSDAPQAVGSTIETVTRRGKYLIAPLDDGRELIVHLGMTGSLRVLPADDDPHGEPDPYVRAWWDLDDGARLTFRDVRRFGRIAVVDSGAYSSLPTLAALGPDPFEAAFDGPSLWAALRSSDRHLKTQLLSQRPVAGVGNIYADEAFWLAGVNPADRGITRARAAALADAIRVALQSGLDHGGTTLRDYVDADGASGDNQHHLYCYGRAGEPCERCGTVLRRRLLDARTTTWCPACQPPRR